MKTPKGTELHLIDLKGKKYLQVAQRLVWFREEKPAWRIHTEFVEINNDMTIAKASILDDQGNVIATAHKREDRAHFADHMEKAEAGAIGRALAYCGYGTQFCADELDEGERIVDAPQEHKEIPTPIRQSPMRSRETCECGGKLMKSKFGPGLYCPKCKSKYSETA
jgi:hypothetical protein